MPAMKALAVTYGITTLLALPQAATAPAP